MNTSTWSSLEEFLNENELEFTHVETDEEYGQQLYAFKEENQNVAKFINGDKTEELCCKRWKPVRKRVCRWVTYPDRRQYECTTHVVYECVERC